MKRPFLVWFVFAACAAVGFGVLGWFSSVMLRLERETAEARRVAGIEESIRLALWRMDSALASVHGLEAARPWQEYESFSVADAAFSAGLAPLPAGSIMVPSPLLSLTPPFVKLHFQIGADGEVTSPQAPPWRQRVPAIAAGVSPDRLDAAAETLRTLTPTVATAEWRTLIPAPAALTTLVAEEAKEKQEWVQTPVSVLVEKISQRRQLEIESAPPPATAPLTDLAATPVNAPAPQRELQQQQLKSAVEQVERDNLLYAFNELNLENANRNRSSREAPVNRALGGAAPLAEGTVAAAAAPAESPAARTDDEARAGRSEAASDAAAAPMMLADAAPVPTALVGTANGTFGSLQAVWLGSELVLARRVAFIDHEIVQGAWLDWSELQAWLLSRVADLLPDSRLLPVPPGSVTTALDAARRLAFLPVQLAPGRIEYVGVAAPSPLRISLGAAWISALLGVAALAVLLRGTMRLSERRGAFVSAVTHELRTPLTTFRMYTEMLAGGMVTDETKRRGYVDTLRKEAERLSHLVENVLSYARLERGRAASRVEDTTPGDLFARIEERLRQRAEQGGLELRIAFAEGAADRALRTDTTAVEQILFNLVDNATKYGRPATGGGTIAIAVAPRADGGVVMRVADGGPGIAASVRKRLFQPFSKSADEAAVSQPGVGLGLALSRRLARDEIRGELTLERTGPDGTVFRLELPATAGR